ncbi:MAG: ABC transporter permease subunit [Myxococcales bacterium]|nr:ABC transporter permease subunit [Myxococcales bacterium]
MTDVVTVLRKELAELFGDRHSVYGAMIQTAILVALCGVVVPLDRPTVWRDAGAVAMLYGVFPAVLAATFAADAFAGERERRTLETVLATPIAARSLFLGKLAAAVALALLGALVAMTTGAISATAAAGALPPALTARHAAMILLGATGYATLTAVLATQISMRVAVARTAQQAASMLSIAITAGLALVLRRLHVDLDWDTLPRVAGAMVALGAALVVVGDGGFRRHRIFDPDGPPPPPPG